MRQRSFILAAVVAASVSMSGCGYVSPEAANAALIDLRDRVATMEASIQQTEADITEARGNLQTLEQALQAAETPDERSAIVAQIAAHAAFIEGAEERLEGVKLARDTANAAVAEVESVIAEYEQPSDPITQGVSVFTPFLPEPYRVPVVFGAATIASLWRSNRLRGALGSVVRSIDEAARQNSTMAAGLNETAPTLRRIQTPLAQRLVDAEQNKRTKLPI